MIYYYTKLKDKTEMKQFKNLDEAFETARNELNINYDIQIIIDFYAQNIYSKNEHNYKNFDYYRFENRLFDVYDSELFQNKWKLIKADFEF